MVTYLEWQTTKIPLIENRNSLVTGWMIEDIIHGTLTYWARWNDGTLARSLPIDLYAITKYQFDFPGRLWKKTQTIPDNAIMIGWFEPPKRIED